MASLSVSIAALWARIHSVVDAISPTTAESFNGPATATEIGQLEGVLGFALPSELKLSLAIHNGQKPIPRSPHGLTLDGTLLDTESIIDAWEMVTSVDQEFQRTDPDWGKIEWWNRQWIPICDDGGGDYLCINMDTKLMPAGCLVHHVHDNPFYPSKWPSLGVWLEEIALKLESGHVDRSRDWLCVLHDEDIPRGDR